MVNSLIDIVFDGVLDKEEIAKRFYDDWSSTCINTSNLVNPPEFIKKILDFEKAEFEVCNDGEGLFGITISKKSCQLKLIKFLKKFYIKKLSLQDFS